MLVIATVGLAAACMWLVERWLPGRSWPRVARWGLRAALLTGAQVAIVVVTGRALDPLLAGLRPWSADGLGTPGGALVGYLAIAFVYYWWHRARHEIPLLWRWLHQVHHSPQRLELFATFYKHPLEIALNALLSSAILYGVVGLAPTAAALSILLTGLAELFYHWNVKTPFWLGFLVQRPESHCVHHQTGFHHTNYADLPLWDWLFGTLHNPRAWQGRCGFGDSELRLGEMLRGIDVSTPSGARR